MRKLSPYEKTHLARFGKSTSNIAAYGEMPVEYITGKVEFCDTVFAVNQNVLIPRIETEELVKLALDSCHPIPVAGSQNQLHRSRNKPACAGRSGMTIADVGTGCGAIGISLALTLQKQKRDYQIYLSDISEKALLVAKQNASKLLPKTANYKIIKSDLLKSYPKDLKFDLVIANLPYIPSARIAYLDESVKDFEPQLALDGGSDGLKYIKKLIKQSESKLKSDGIILLEIDHTHTLSELQALSSKFKVEIKLDSFERSRFAIFSQSHKKALK